MYLYGVSAPEPIYVHILLVLYDARCAPGFNIPNPPLLDDLRVGLFVFTFNSYDIVLIVLINRDCPPETGLFSNNDTGNLKPFQPS